MAKKSTQKTQVAEKIEIVYEPDGAYVQRALHVDLSDRIAPQDGTASSTDSIIESICSRVNRVGESAVSFIEGDVRYLARALANRLYKQKESRTETTREINEFLRYMRGNLQYCKQIPSAVVWSLLSEKFIKYNEKDDQYFVAPRRGALAEYCSAIVEQCILQRYKEHCQKATRESREKERARVAKLSSTELFLDLLAKMADSVQKNLKKLPAKENADRAANEERAKLELVMALIKKTVKQYS